jgi:hypothetical protein
MQASVLDLGLVIPGTSLPADVLDTGALGALIGAVGAVALSRSCRRFRMT